MYELLERETKKNVLTFWLAFNIIICRWKEMKVRKRKRKMWIRRKKNTLKLKKRHWGIKVVAKIYASRKQRIFIIFFLIPLNTFFLTYYLGVSFSFPSVSWNGRATASNGSTSFASLFIFLFEWFFRHWEYFVCMCFCARVLAQLTDAYIFGIWCFLMGPTENQIWFINMNHERAKPTVNQCYVLGLQPRLDGSQKKKK